MSDFIRVSDETIYDGWVVKYYPETQTFEWRDHWVVDKLSNKRKKKLEQTILTNWT